MIKVQTQTVPGEAKSKTEAKSQPLEKYAKSTLFVRGLPKSATNEELESFFSNVGPVRSCFVVAKKIEEAAVDVPENKDGNEEAAKTDGAKKTQLGNRGFGFVQFVLAEDAARAIEELADTKFRNKKRLMLDFAMKKHARASESGDQKPAKRPRQDLQTSESISKKPKTDIGKNNKTKVESRTITISGIPSGTTKKHIIKRVKKISNPHSVVYPIPFKDATEEQLKDGAGGAAHVTFDNHAMALKAVKSLDNHVFKGAKLAVKLKLEYINKGARLIVRNLPFKVRERDLENLLSDCGTVLDVDLPRKFTGGPLRGFAFIQMGDYVSAQRAVAKWNESTLQGRTISVALAIAKDKFKEMEEKGEIEKPEFGDDDAEMEAVDGSDIEEDSSDAVEAEDSDGDAKVDVDDEDGDDNMSQAASEVEDVIDESLQEGCTLFIRNLSFDSEESGLFELFRTFGRLRYCRIVHDNQTGRSRGTAFVCYWNSADAAKCLNAAEKAQSLSEKLGRTPGAATAARSDQHGKSILLQEASKTQDATSQFVLDGRMLSVVKAVDRNSADNMAAEGEQKRKGKDKRHAYLLKEGVVFPDTPLATLMAPPDLEHHVKEYSVRKNQILKNPNLYMSKTRLTIHNIPRSIDDAALRSSAISAISKFKQEIKAQLRQPLSKEEMEEGWDKMPRLMQAKIVRSTDRVDASTGKSRSLGYGFIEFSHHAHALACLRYLNFSNSKQAFSKHLIKDDESADVKKSAHKISRRSLRVMFAIENAQIVKKRELRFAHIKKRQGSKSSAGASAPDTPQSNGRSKQAQKKGKGRGGKGRASEGAPWWDGGKAAKARHKKK
ncbi:RNA-binding domain-containing protein [Coemansia reversa NRRL 1564]|uniref:RNA-binding domain-containing protein n=1 Tax=Coemansia reversa (strain ATCC 12441 / NRRL 1564) TaxID=763665 RepID=A0A2G5BKV0_COERN|nr:RNA-binding domain-containing protein [Coemansia reversa NRRL 1564]|eukprot:PIA19636.1 RNA-binding domain-containing protein [Coemansia reversa NRRL 1564]